MSNRRRVEEEDADYFGESVKKNRKNNDSSYADSQPTVDDDEIDPLDAFMAGLESAPAPAKPNARKAERIEIEDSVDVYMQQRKQKLAAILKDPQLAAILAARNIDLTKDDMTTDLNIDDIKTLLVDDGGDDPIQTGKDSDDDLEEDELDVEKLKKSKLIPLLPPIDHAAMDYPEFNKDFLTLHSEIKALDEVKITELRRVLDVRVSGSEVPSPAMSFGHFGFDEAIMKEIRKSGFEKPTPIQCQAIPIALSGRDLIGIAQTGSGKTAAFVWPMLVHIMDQYELQKGDGPIGLIVAPTRELSEQIYQVAKQFAKGFGVNVAPIYGGTKNKFEQFKMLKAGCEIVVCTPGRLIDLLKMKATNLHRVTFLVLDEADKMFDMGFGQQINSILGQIRPNRQVLLFSATMKRRVERLARDILDDPIRVTVGDVGAANNDIRQIAVCLDNEESKLGWMAVNLPTFLTVGPALVFVATKVGCDLVAAKMLALGHKAAALHGDKAQTERSDLVRAFKKGDIQVLVATDVAARGLDIKGLRSVISYDCARDIDSHTHRIGRTGRAGAQDGTAFTLVTPAESRFAGDLVTSLEVASQTVTAELLAIARQNPRFRSRRPGPTYQSANATHRGRGGRRIGSAPVGIGFTQATAGFSSNSNTLPVSRPVQQYGSARAELATDYANSLRKSFSSSFVKSSTVLQPDSAPINYAPAQSSTPAPPSVSVPTPSTAPPPPPGVHPSRMAQIANYTPPVRQQPPPVPAPPLHAGYSAGYSVGYSPHLPAPMYVPPAYVPASAAYVPYPPSSAYAPPPPPPPPQAPQPQAPAAASSIVSAPTDIAASVLAFVHSVDGDAVGTKRKSRWDSQ